MSSLRRLLFEPDPTPPSDYLAGVVERLESEVDFLRSELRRRDELHVEEVRRISASLDKLAEPSVVSSSDREVDSDGEPTSSTDMNRMSGPLGRKRFFVEGRSEPERTQEEKEVNRELLKLEFEFFKLFPTLLVTLAVALFTLSQILGLAMQNAVLGSVFFFLTFGVALFSAFFVPIFFEDGKHPGTFLFSTKLVTVALSLATVYTFFATSIEEGVGTQLPKILQALAQALAQQVL